MHNIYLQNEPKTNTVTASVEKKSSHKMLQTKWIILYLRPVSGMIKVLDESPMSDVYVSTFVLSVDAFFSCLVIFLFTTMESPFRRSRRIDSS